MEIRDPNGGRGAQQPVRDANICQVGVLPDGFCAAARMAQPRRFRQSWSPAPP